MRYNIQEVSYGVLGSATTIEVEVMNFVLGSESADVAVKLMDGANVLERKLVPLSQEVYQQWGTDDSVVLNYVVSELGLTLVVDGEVLP